MLNNYQGGNRTYNETSVSNKVNAVAPKFLKFEGMHGRCVVVNINDIGAIYFDGYYNIVELTDGSQYYCLEPIDAVFKRLEKATRAGNNTET